MAYFLFVDESGQDLHDSPYEVLAGVAVEDHDLWNMVQSLQEAEIRHFGMRYTANERELKAAKLLKSKTYRQAAQLPPFDDEERRILARRCLESGETAGRREQTALAQAKLTYVQEALDICTRFHCKAFASIISKQSQRPTREHLRKDYAYLFERFYYFLEDRNPSLSGIIVFDELDKSQSHILVSQMDRYFKEFATGRQRASQIIPEPFFVHSDLTTGVQLADLVAYIISWGVRIEGQGMTEPARDNLKDYAEQVCGLRYYAKREVRGNPNFGIWSFAYIKDLRSRGDREDIEEV